MSDRDVTTFVRGYARTWVHALAAAAMTAFGTLTAVHRGFAALALVAYLLPPLVLYVLGWDPSGGDPADEATDRTARPAGGSERDAGGAERDTGSGERNGGSSEPNAGSGERDASERPAADGHVEARTVAGDTGVVDEQPANWAAVDVPTGATLTDVALADGDAVAVGADGVVVAGGDEWDVLLESGPGADGNTLRGTAATGDGARVWVAGDGGALGRLDVESGRHVDHSAPEGVTDTWTDVAVAGPAGDETVLLVNGSGEVLRGQYREGAVTWADPLTPGSGSSLSGATLATPAVGHLCDTNDGVFETTDGRTFRAVGVEADGTLTDVATAGVGDCLVSADDGVLHRYDGATWTPVDLADGALHAVSRSGPAAIACGDDALHTRPSPDADWTRTLPPAAGDLRGVAVGPSRAVAVGTAGTVVSRER